MKSYSFKRRLIYLFLYISGISWLCLKFFSRKYPLHVYGHRVLNPNSDINKFFIDSGHALSSLDFKKRVKLLNNSFQSTDINNFIEDSFLISFDDGYIDNLNIALPILKKYNIPVHIFIITNVLKNKVLFWPDIIGYICCNIRGKFKFNFSDKEYSFISNNDRIKSYLDICAIFKEKSNFQIKKYLNSIIKTTKYNPKVKFEDLYISEEDITKNHSLVSYGAHSFDHENLCLLNDKDLKDTINDSIDYISKFSNQKVTTFAYPYGLYNENIINYFEDYKPCKYSFITKTNNSKSNYEMNRINLNLNPYFVFHVEISGAYNWIFKRRKLI